MGLLQKACETYDANQALAGVYRDGHEVLPPIGHILTAADIEITINVDGQFIHAVEVPKDAPDILIPATEKSMGRSGTKAPPHPLCDELKYIGPHNVEFHQMYLDELRKWCDSSFSHPILKAVYEYVLKETILNDLAADSLIVCENGKPKDEKIMIRWCVTGVDDEEACWKNKNLHELYVHYIISQISMRRQDICMVTGDESVAAYQHAKGIASLHGNAKLISANDFSGFTYRGRFNTDTEAMNVSYIASQKAHNALRWLIGEQRCYYGKKVFLCWNPNGIPVPSVTDPFGFTEEVDALADIDAYKEHLQKTLAGHRTRIPDNEAVVIASFDAATTGRLSLHYYSELPSSDFLERLYAWDEQCCWYFGKRGVQSPKLLTIIRCAFGTERKSGAGVFMEVEDREKAQQLLRLLACRMSKAAMPADIKDALVRKASTPLAYEPVNRRLILSTACAVIKKYDHDRKGVNWEMALKPEKRDLSYQYGRLLAVLEKAETDTYGAGEERESNAIRMQSIFVQRPQYAATRILEQLNKAYFQRLSAARRGYYKRLIGEIYAMIDEFPEQEHNRPLQDSYLMGYYLQRNELKYSKKQNATNDHEEVNENDTAE